MPCTLCGNQGHNRRTCQQWQVLEASRQEEEERINEEQMVHTQSNIDIHDIYNRRNIYSTPEILRRPIYTPPDIQRHIISSIHNLTRDIVPTQLFPDSDYIPFDSVFG
jgi:hypothetical protein